MPKSSTRAKVGTAIGSLSQFLSGAASLGASRYYQIREFSSGEGEEKARDKVREKGLGDRYSGISCHSGHVLPHSEYQRFMPIFWA
ncbi:hypothetical protein R1flu_023936 [Riccia fluitans]|uniref:Uncharacterized protein n=1 Tax=Riccia fluitans TaxID=41844 RepID=A0ABD1XTG4_9MARC